MSDTALQVQQNALTALLADPERLNALPIDKLERLFDLNERMLAATAKAEFQAAFARVQSQIEVVPKRGSIRRKDGSITTYAKIEDVVGMLHPLLIEHGFTRSTSCGDTPIAADLSGVPMTRFTLLLRHAGGHEEAHHLDVPITAGKGGSMNVMQSIVSTASYCEKHLIVKVFGFVTGDDNDGADVKGQEPITEQQVSDLEALIAEVEPGPGFVTFLRDVFRAERPSEIAQADFPKVVRALEMKRRAQ